MRTVFWTPILLFLLYFGKYLLIFLQIGVYIILEAFNLPSPGLPKIWSLVEAFQILGFNCCFGFLFFFLIWLFVISSQALLPTNGLWEIGQTAKRLLLYIFGLHGPAIFVKDGKEFAAPEEMKRTGPGVAVVNFNSAIVLEERVAPEGISKFFWFFVERGHPQSPRVSGPGLAFTWRRERIRGIVDLRRQFRRQGNVSAYTRDGIEITTGVTCQFSLGQSPEVLYVGYVGGRRAENLRVLSLQRTAEPSPRVTVTKIVDELDAADKAEIHRAVHIPPANAALQTAEQRLRPGPPAKRPEAAPIFDGARVSAAVLSEARDPNNGDLINWSDLPSQVAAQIFKEMLMRENYDQIYRVDDPTVFPLNRIRDNFRAAVRNQGILSYCFVRSAVGATIEARTYEQNELICYPETALTSPKVLRQRGIKINAAGFGDLTPVNEIVSRQRFESWNASWASETDVEWASREREALRIRGLARAQAQQEMVSLLNDILKQTDYSREALALRVFQALENAATDPNTRQLLPADTLNMLKSLNDWLKKP